MKQDFYFETDIYFNVEAKTEQRIAKKMFWHLFSRNVSRFKENLTSVNYSKA